MAVKRKWSFDDNRCAPDTRLCRPFHHSNPPPAPAAIETPAATSPQCLHRSDDLSTTSPQSTTWMPPVLTCPNSPVIPEWPPLDILYVDKMLEHFLMRQDWVRTGRVEKYGEEVADCYYPGLTPVHVREEYIEKQRRGEGAFWNYWKSPISEAGSDADDENVSAPVPAMIETSSAKVSLCLQSNDLPIKSACTPPE